MTRHDPWVRVRHMRDHAQEAIELLGEKTLDELKSDRTVQLALVQLIEIVGEAASRVDPGIRTAHPAVPWQLAAGMRHRLIHGYDLIEYAVVYDTVKGDLPLLVAQLDSILPPTDV
ncbi:MAG: DUF86 domain-containing protein [Planctomycetes bacterium]|nr:DUF86 domain-containing protein [Planctomycetota bacterium]